MKVMGRLEELFSVSLRGELEGCLAEYIAPRRWFRSKTRVVAGLSIEEMIPLPMATEVALTLLRVRYTEGPPEDYVLPLTWVDGESGEQLVRSRPHLLVAAVTVGHEARVRWIVDALGEPRALDGLRALVARGDVVRAGSCTLVFRLLSETPITAATPRPVDVEQTNTSVVYGDASILKIVRKLEDGTSPDLEMGEFLTRAGYTHTPRLLAAIELTRRSGEPATVGMMHEFVTNDGDAWASTLARIRRAAESPEAIDTALVRRLGQRVAELHVALSSPTQDAGFLPAPIERQERRALGEAAGRSLEVVWDFVEEHAATLPREVADRLRQMRIRLGDYRRCITDFVDAEHRFMKTRVHGDLHLGQVLVTGDDFMLIDFEGEPARSLAERKAKRSPFADVAGMLRSLHYASVAASREASPSDRARVATFAEAWHRRARREFLRSYTEAAVASPVFPRAAEARSILLRFYLLEKCVYELHYEINNRPDWVAIPVLGLEQILEDDDAA